ncbi:biotin--[acetyl-CoA-carboxylase] ligase [Massilia sp. PAMC28688]|uniref:biotin--[acetyl-CoA-carboxylase] ligase n=1 Tax=Massilia sp. PAMC28688 TaxID=2861283 RepID=UPI001C62D180|nr:biotin--[acetyl-CoA-carboxylase] ligase [Massilia sp. PAMC28688]QYF94547.1 biotin--[acetyl-CoA-carboxylase] ligase [Massilia sp. PAMC28688]
MNAQAIAGKSADSGVAVQVVAQTGSTNADLLAQLPLAGNRLLIAERQSAGRGRAGRSWLSGEDSLTFSLAWKFPLPLHALSGLPLAVGVALAETLDQLGVRVQLKWPNDVLKDGAKLAGILVETQAAPDGVWAVIGIGMNLIMPDALEQRIGRPAAGAPWLARMDRDTLMAQLLNHLAASLRHFEQAGFAAFCARWNRLHAFQGSEVAIIDRGVTLEQGVAAGVDDCGVLLLDTAAGRVPVMAGDVSLRAVAP